MTLEVLAGLGDHVEWPADVRREPLRCGVTVERSGHAVGA
jgi:hypothetical protein